MWPFLRRNSSNSDFSMICEAFVFSFVASVHGGVGERRREGKGVVLWGEECEGVVSGRWRSNCLEGEDMGQHLVSKRV